TGYGLIESDGRSSRHVASGTIRTEGDDLAERLGAIFRGVGELIDAHQPGEVAIESVFIAKNASSALKLGQARGAAICACAARALPVAEYTPRAVKLAIVGAGGADKAQVQHMVRVLLKLTEPLTADSADALGIALCHAHTDAAPAVLAARRMGRGR
ncbi:MAG: crossover junction endodeoxyribonuclease RuvC, partial [Chromatiales bacterium]